MLTFKHLPDPCPYCGSEKGAVALINSGLRSEGYYAAIEQGRKDANWLLDSLIKLAWATPGAYLSVQFLELCRSPDFLAQALEKNLPGVLDD